MAHQEQRTIARIVSGGQSGADRAALDAAIAAGVPYGGWCPAGGWAEDLPEPPGLLALYARLWETDSPDPDVRTRLNVRDSDATLLVLDPEPPSSGSALARRTALELGKPVLVTTGSDVDEVLDWLEGLGPGLTLNVAGPRESEQPGVYARTRRLVEALVRRGAGST